MNSKKIISAIMAGVCALSMTSIAAFAADATQKVTAAGSYDLSTDAGYTAPVIDVTLPTSLKAVINPYQIKIEIASGVETGTSGITSPEYEIENNSDTFGIKVGAKLSAKGTGIAVVSDKTKIPTKDDSEKTAYVELLTTVGTEEKTLAFTEDKPDKATNVMTLDKKAKGTFQIQGEVTDPEKVEKPYAATDKLTLSIIFELNPYNDGAAGGNGGGNTFTAPAGTTAEAACSDASVTAFARVSNKDNEYNMTIDSSAYSAAFLPDLKLDTGYEIVDATSSTTGTATVATTGIAANKWKITVVNVGTTDISYDIAASTDTSTVVSTITIHVTVE